jgi:hypothetical protein
MKNKKIFIGIIILIGILACMMSVYAISMNLEIKGEHAVEIRRNNTINSRILDWK